MNILVTGGAGHIGREVIARLLRHGHKVRVADLQPERLANEVAGAQAETAQCDITDFAAVLPLMDGIQAVVHLAAIPNPNAGSGPDIFRVNCAGTYNIFEAAARAGIRRVATASSINAFGLSFSVQPFAVTAFPVDEDQPGSTSDPYSFSKKITEEIAAYYWRRDRISSCCLRLPGVYRADDGLRDFAENQMGRYLGSLQAILALPDEERRLEVARLYERLAWKRSIRLSERPYDPADYAWMQSDPNTILMGIMTDLWAAISVEDAAQAFEKALLADYEGSHPLYVCEPKNIFQADAEQLASTFYPEKPARTRSLAGAESLISSARARQVIGFEPQHVYLDRARSLIRS